MGCKRKVQQSVISIQTYADAALNYKPLVALVTMVSTTITDLPLLMSP